MKKILLVVLVLGIFSGVAYSKDDLGILQLADKLQNCRKYKASFKHPFTGEKLNREIIGMVGGKCVYTEGMPNGGEMKCKYSRKSLASIAQYYRDTAKAKTLGTRVSTGSLTSDSKPKIEYRIDGKVVSNPLQECLNNGDCVISGY